MQQTPAAVPTPEAAPVPVPAPAVQQAVATSQPRVQVLVPGQEGATPQAVFEALIAQRSELRDQLSELEDTRRRIAERLTSTTTQGANRAGLEVRLANVDQQIAATEKAIAAANADVARAAAVPGAVVEEPPPPEEFIDEDAVGVLAFLIFFLVILPITVAYTRRLWKKAGTAVMTLPVELYERMTRLEQSVEAVAIEVERIGEGQRFMTRVLSEQREPQPVPLSAGADPAPARR